MRPAHRLVLALGRHRHDFELRHAQRALAERGADAVGARVAAADDDDVLALGRDLLAALGRLARHAAVLLRQEIHGKVQALQVTARRLGEEVERRLGAAREQQRVVRLLEVQRRHVLADVHVAMERHALGLHLLHAALDDALLHLEVGDAVAQ